MESLKRELANRPTDLDGCPDFGQENPYQRFAGDDLILRDQLAIDRTVLANERTFLAYVRTSLALVLTGAGCLKFFGGLFYDIAGGVLIALGFVVAGVGAWRSIVTARNIGTVNKTPPRERHADTAPESGHLNFAPLEGRAPARPHAHAAGVAGAPPPSSNPLGYVVQKRFCAKYP